MANVNAQTGHEMAGYSSTRFLRLAVIVCGTSIRNKETMLLSHFQFGTPMKPR